MKRARILLLALIITTMTVVTSCSDQGLVGPKQAASAPQAAALAPKPRADLVGGLLNGLLGTLLQCQALPAASVTQVIGSKGGVIKIGPHSFTVPAGALSTDVAITATIPPGKNARVVFFEPSGLQFAQPATLILSYRGCSLLGVILPKKIAIVDDNLGILGYLLSLDNILSDQVSGKVPHFTGYAVAW